jgi:[ribosomal protein S5]-alanine N-acetyltransferase
MASDGERIVRQIYEAFNQPGSLEETLALMEPLLHPDAEYVNPPDAVEPGIRRGPAGWRAVVEGQRTGLGPAATAGLDEVVARGDRVFVRSSLRTGGGSSGVEVDGPTIGGVWTIRDGLIARYEWRWDADDARALFESQAGAVPASPLALVTPDVALLDAAIRGPGALGRALGCEVAENWDMFPAALPRARAELARDPASARWGTRLFVLRDPRTVVGFGGFKGPPQAGAVELGYAIAPDWQGRGLATAAVRELLSDAFGAPDVQRVTARTLAEPGPSVRVLEKNGFANDGEVGDREVGTAWHFHLERPEDHPAAL